MRSHLFFFAAARIASATRSERTVVERTFTPAFSAALPTSSASACPCSAHCFSTRATSLAVTVMPPSKYEVG